MFYKERPRDYYQHNLYQIVSCWLWEVLPSQCANTRENITTWLIMPTYALWAQPRATTCDWWAWHTCYHISSNFAFKNEVCLLY